MLQVALADQPGDLVLAQPGAERQRVRRHRRQRGADGLEFGTRGHRDQSAPASRAGAMRRLEADRSRRAWRRMSGLGIVAPATGADGRRRGAAAGATKSRHRARATPVRAACSGRGARGGGTCRSPPSSARPRRPGSARPSRERTRPTAGRLAIGARLRAPRGARAACRRDRPASASSASRGRASRGSPTRAGRRRTSSASPSRRCASRSRRDDRRATLRRRRRRDGRAADRTRARMRAPLRG